MLGGSDSMPSNLEQKSVSKQQRISKIAEDRFPFSQSRQVSKHQGGLKGKGCTDHPTNCDHVKCKVRNKDELVKYMSNLPGYLQSMEGGENFQGKALSFGVLDWELLENWKHGMTGIKGTGYNYASSSGITSSEKTTIKSSSPSSMVSAVSPSSREEKYPSGCSTVCSPNKDYNYSQPSVQKTKCFQEYESSSRSKLDEQKRTQRNGNSFGMNYTEVFPRKGKKAYSYQNLRSGAGNFSSHTRKCGASLGFKENISAILPSDQFFTLEVGASSTKPSKYGASCSESEKITFKNDESKRIGEELQDSEVDLSHQYHGSKPTNIILLRTRKFSQTTQPEEHQAFRDENLIEKKGTNFSADITRQEGPSLELGSRFPYPCTPSFSFQTNSEWDMSAELLSETPKTSKCQDNRRNIERECSEQSNSEVWNQSLVENTCMLDQEMSEMASRKGRHPSPNRRFSFSFSQIGRSFSFKEGSSASQMSPPHVSARSGPLRYDGSAYTDGSIREKPNGHNRTRSSPFRRMLDPFLKSKGENSVPFKGVSTSSNPITSITNKLLQNEKHATSMIRALLQFTVRNGIHLFQFVVGNDNRNVLVATMKNPTSCEKEDSTRFYTFYSVNEVKKKIGSRIIQGNKEKHHGFSYNIIGRMKLSASLSSDKTAHESNDRYTVKESILFDVEPYRADQSSQNPMPSGELAAIVNKLPGENSSDLRNSEENGHNIETTIILPSDVHSVSKDGVLSPLIDRWKSGGSCDCGGWDIGCKLRLLSNHISKTSKSRLNNFNNSSFQFFDQEGDQQQKPIFTLVPLNNGFYSVEFDSSLSLIQAFFISITVISCQDSSLLSESSDMPEAKLFQEPMRIRNDHHTKKTPITASRRMPVKYASNPPLSPVGRV